LQERISKLYFDDSIPSVLKRDLHVYQMQNMSAVGTLTKAQVQISLENQGLSSDTAQLGAMVAAAAASGGLVGRTGGAKEPIFKTTREARVAAEGLGFKKINETVHGGQAVFRKGNLYITRDLDGHNGGAWKMAASVKDLSSRSTRMGTYDSSLNRIGD
jgi:filamentous hemagglutinin